MYMINSLQWLRNRVAGGGGGSSPPNLTVGGGGEGLNPLK